MVVCTDTITGHDSDEKHKAHAGHEQPGYLQETDHYERGAPPPMEPHPGSSRGSVSSSDKEDLEEAREDYENASGSDKEEAREEYEEQYEETYGD